MASWEYIEKYIEKKALVTTKSGMVYEGVLYGPYSEFDTSHGKNGIEVDTGEYYEELAFDEIEKIEQI